VGGKDCRKWWCTLHTSVLHQNPVGSAPEARRLTLDLRQAAGVVGALALVAVLAAALFLYKRNQGHKGEGTAGIAKAPRRGPGSSPAAALTADDLQAKPLLMHTCHAAVHTASAYEPGWSPEEMSGDMCALEEAAEGLVAALRSNPNARGGLRRAAHQHQLSTWSC
jgi:hypothetical protein